MNIVEELKRKLENADSDEIRVLEQTEEAVYWFLLLAEYPEFAPRKQLVVCVAEPLRYAVEQVAHQTTAVCYPLRLGTTLSQPAPPPCKTF